MDNLYNTDGLSFLDILENNSVDLILTDPPYIISKESGMDKHYQNVKQNKENDIEFVKSFEQWQIFKEKNKNKTFDEKEKENYLKYGTVYGKKYCVQTNYGNWDSEFTLETLDKFIEKFYQKLKKGGTCIIFFDIWKISILKQLLEKHKFKQIRLIEWIKTNPQPRNSKINYLTNARECALLAVKHSNPIFNSSYDNGLYFLPIQGGKRIHPTQKSLILFEQLIEKHSNKDDLVIDPFLGSGTTFFACNNKQRNFKGCEINKEYYDHIINKAKTDHKNLKKE